MSLSYLLSATTVCAMAGKSSVYVVTANRTDDGISVYRGQGGEWRTGLSEAQIHADEVSAAAELQAAKQEERLICDPYIVPVGVDAEGHAVALSARERIRAHGPTSRVRRPDPQVCA